MTAIRQPLTAIRQPLTAIRQPHGSLSEGCQKAVRLLAKCFLNAVGMLSECLWDACRVLADSAQKNDCRMLRECWQNVVLLLPDAPIACQKAVRTLAACYPNPEIPLAGCNQNPELLRVHSARLI